jgi:HNH endonuclease
VPGVTVSSRVRFEVFRRDDYTCRYCRAADQPLTVDHVLPTVLGGTDDPSNLVTACRDCNAGKGSTAPDSPLVAQVTDDAVRWALAMQKAAAQALAAREDAQGYVGAFDEHWQSYEKKPGGTPVPRNAGYASTLRTWQAMGLPLPILLDSVDIAMGNDRLPDSKVWRYLCGIAWNRIRELQDAARGLL